MKSLEAILAKNAGFESARDLRDFSAACKICSLEGYSQNLRTRVMDQHTKSIETLTGFSAAWMTLELDWSSLRFFWLELMKSCDFFCFDSLNLRLEPADFVLTLLELGESPGCPGVLQPSELPSLTGPFASSIFDLWLF